MVAFGTVLVKLHRVIVVTPDTTLGDFRPPSLCAIHAEYVMSVIVA
jgi:hypothetical protein